VNHKLNVALLIGGVSFGDQEAKITRGADVLIATPGRLLDFADRGKILLTGIEILVIDEADRMLDMGFIPDIEKICKLVPFTRQTLFFSATMPPEITRLTEQFLQNPVRIEVSRPASTNVSIAQSLVKTGVSPQEKRATLRRVIRSADSFKNAIIFCNRKRDVQVVYRSLEKHGFSVGALHGDLDQRARMAALESFRNGTVQLLVCSDVAARGLDIPDVSHVINYDAPHHAEDYVHRIGRTGRAGKTGVAVTLATRLDSKNIDEIEKLIARKIDWAPGGVEVDDEAEAAPAPAERGRRREGRDRSERPAGRERRPESRGRSEPREPRPSAPPQAAAAPRASAPAQPAAPGRRRSREDYDDAPVVGLGDHVPSFLLRPTRLPRPVAVGED
jgi:superfamily II DNA/RNA helicase